MDSVTQALEQIDGAVWGVPLIVLIIAGGVLLTVRIGCLQIRKLPMAIRLMLRKEDGTGGEGEISSFGALMTALSATIGTGNIVGVATAICAGGPGALFWMVIAALIGMATKFSEGVLAIKYRVFDEKTRHVLGGPFCYIEHGMGPRWKWMAKLFALFGVLAGLLGIGTISQVNGISNAVRNFFDPDMAHTLTIPGIGTFSVATVIASVVIAFAVALILIGGIRRIASVSDVVVPTMAIIYIVTIVTLLVCNVTEIPHAVVTIVQGAFNPSAVTGGVIGSMIIAVQKGVSRGIFSNEAGLGSAPIAAAAARTKEPVRQGLISMMGTFIDTIVICTMTGLAIVITGAWQVEGLEGVEVTTYAFVNGLPFPETVAKLLLMLCLVFFAFTTILGWNYYSERCLEYLSGGKTRVLKIFRWLYIIVVFIGPYLTVSAVWTISDIFNGLMAIPNMIALFALSGVVAKEVKSYFRRQKEAEAKKLESKS